jgi:NAD(P)-dependent dehydrogenase (short-subunit alcohol dehydrogenase family)
MNAKVVVITGASRGLGRAMAEEFIRLGHRVLGCGRSAKAIRELDARYGPDHRFSVVDVIDVNIKGVANVIRHFVPAMVARKHGVIVNFSSGWGRATDAEVGPYCTTKWAIEGLSKSLAQELPRGMAAIPLNPGIIDTDMLRSTFGKEASNYPSAETWAETAVPWLLGLRPADNGHSLTVGKRH